MKIKKYKSQAARDAMRINYGDKSYWQYLDRRAKEHSDYYKRHGDENMAKKMFTQSLNEALAGNDGD